MHCKFVTKDSLRHEHGGIGDIPQESIKRVRHVVTKNLDEHWIEWGFEEILVLNPTLWVEGGGLICPCLNSLGQPSSFFNNKSCEDCFSVGCTVAKFVILLLHCPL